MVSIGSAPRRVLIVDDCQDTVTVLRLLLKRSGNEVHVAYDGPEAIKTAEEIQPDIILLDITLPTMNGYDVARNVRSQPWGRHINLIALSGWDLEKDHNKAIEAGFNLHLLKPVHFSALEKVFAELAAAAT